MVTVAGAGEDGSLQRDGGDLRRGTVLGRAALQGPVAHAVSPQLVQGQGSPGVIRPTDRSPGGGIVGAQATLEQPSTGQPTYEPLPELVRATELPPRPEGWLLFDFLPVIAVQRNRLVVLELLVPRHLSRLALLPGPPLVRLPLALRQPRTLVRLPGRLSFGRFGNGSVAKNRCRGYHSGSRCNCWG